MKAKGKSGKRSLINNFILRNQIGSNLVEVDESDSLNSEKNISFESFSETQDLHQVAKL